MSGRRHLLIRIGRHNSANEFAFGWLSRHDDVVRFRSNVESQLCLTRLFVRAVTMKASIRKNWPNVRAESDRSTARSGGCLSCDGFGIHRPSQSNDTQTHNGKFHLSLFHASTSSRREVSSSSCARNFCAAEVGVAPTSRIAESGSLSRGVYCGW